jgi:hypothetical protein
MQDNPHKVKTFSANFTREESALMQNKLRITCLSTDFTEERHAFPWYNPCTVLTF